MACNNKSFTSSVDNCVEDDTGFRFSSKLSLEKIRSLQAQFAQERDWDKFHTPRNLLLALVGEVGELSEIFQWKGEVAEGLPGWTEDERTHLSQELSDVLIYLVRLSDKCSIDLPKAVLEKLELNHKKYPADKVWGSCKKYTEYKVSESCPDSHEMNGK